MNRILSLALATALVLPLAASAQGSDFTMGTSSWKCNFSYVGELVERSRDVSLPIAQEMVDSGEILNWGTMTHLFGDEWNVMFYLGTPDGSSFMDTAGAWQSANFAAMSDEDNAAFVENCTEHKDSIYSWAFTTTGGEPGENPTMALSYWQCNFGAVGNIIETMETHALPIGQEMVDSGDLFAYGMMTHVWGDEWNIMFYTATPDDSDLIDTVQEMNGRVFEAVGEEGVELITNSCSAHRDNVYSMPVFTTPRSE